MNKRQKKKQIKLKNKQLIKKYPFLAPKNCWTDKKSKNYDYSYTEFDFIPDGWRIGFGEFLLEDLREACLKTNFLDKLRIIELKEKFGGLRIYTNGVPEEINEVIRKYEFISEYICMFCGNPNAFNINNGGWFMPICEKCWNNRNKKRRIGGYKEVPWSEKIKEEWEYLPNSYKYTTFSKNGNTTTTVDISDTVEKIKNKYKKRRLKNE